MSNPTIALLFATLLLAQVYCQTTWIGSYSDYRYGGKIYLCVDQHNRLSGSYSEVGLLQGEVNTTHAWGEFYQAGTPKLFDPIDCTKGQFIFEMGTYGFDGQYECEGQDFEDDDAGSLWHGERYSGNTPSAIQCGTLILSGDVAGTYTNPNLAQTPNQLAICVDDDDGDQVTWEGSYNFYGSPYPQLNVTSGYIDGHRVYASGRVAVGTWYERNTAGAYMAFVRSNGQLGVYQWTGLVGNDGATVIDPFEYGDDSDQTVTNLNRVTTGDNSFCDSNMVYEWAIEDHVLDGASESEYNFVSDQFLALTKYFTTYDPPTVFVYEESTGDEGDAASLPVYSAILLVAVVLANLM